MYLYLRKEESNQNRSNQNEKVSCSDWSANSTECNVTNNEQFRFQESSDVGLCSCGKWNVKLHKEKKTL